MANDTTQADDGDSSVNRRLFLKSAGVGVSGVALAGCGGDGNGNGNGNGNGTATGGDQFEGEELVFVSEETDDEFRSFFNSINSDFEEETGATVNMDYAGAAGGTANQRAGQLLQAGNAPEILMTGLFGVSQWYQDDVLAPISDAVEAIAEEFGQPSEAVLYQADGEYYFSPFGMNIGNHWYRSDIYDSEPTTWEAALEQAEAQDEEDGVRGVNVIAGENNCTNNQFFGFLKSAGGQVCEWRDGDITAVMDEDEYRQPWIDTLEFMSDLHEYSPDNGNAGCDQAIQAIPNETSAASWYIGSRPKVQAVEQETEFAGDVAVAPHPKPADVDERQVYAGGDGLVTFSDANVELAKAYIDHFFQPEYLNQLYFLTPMHDLPPFPGMADTDEFQSQLDEIISDTGFTEDDRDTIYGAIDNAVTLPGETSPPNPAAGALETSMFASEMTYQACVQGEDPRDIISQHAEELQAMFDEDFN